MRKPVHEEVHSYDVGLSKHEHEASSPLWILWFWERR